MFVTIINFFSEPITNILLILGISGVIISWFISLVPIRIPINILSTLLVVVTVFFKGTQYQDARLQLEMTLLKKQIEIAEVKANELNARIERALEQEVSKTQGVTNEIKQEIQRNKKSIDQCELPESVRMLYNSAVDGKIPRRTAEPNGASPVTKAVRPE